MSDLTSAEWAAWVQAIGSVLAIVAAIFIAGHQHRATERREIEAERRRRAQIADQCLVFGDHLLQCVAELGRACEFQNIGMVQNQDMRLRDLVEFARAINLRDVPIAAVIAVLDLRSIAAEARIVADDTIREGWHGSVQNPGDARHRFERLRERVHDRSLELAAALGDQVARATRDGKT